MTVLHLIEITIPPTVSEQRVEEAANGILRLPETCLHKTTKKPYIKSVKGGRDILDKENRVLVFVFEFENLDDLHYYSHEDSAHLELKKRNATLVADDQGKVNVRARDFEPGKF